MFQIKVETKFKNTLLFTSALNYCASIYLSGQSGLRQACRVFLPAPNPSFLCNFHKFFPYFLFTHIGWILRTLYTIPCEVKSQITRTIFNSFCSMFCQLDLNGCQVCFVCYLPPKQSFYIMWVICSNIAIITIFKSSSADVCNRFF